MASTNEAIVEEVEALQAIMMDEVVVLTGDGDVPCGVEVVVVPATAQRLEEQHVRVTLTITLPPEYPDVPPTITLRNPRGVDDDVLEKIQQESRRKCDEFLGCPVIYELIEVVRDNLTANNTPSCPCAICLHHFTDADHFTKTPCFHYFHSYCLGRYVATCEAEAAAEENEPQPSWMTREKKQIMCPVCRDPIQLQLSSVTLLAALPPEAESSVMPFCPDDPELVALQCKMAALYIAQKQKGGIIDLEEERNKFLLSSERAESCEPLDDGGEMEMVRGCGGGDESSENRPTQPMLQHQQLAGSRRGYRPQHHQRTNNNPPSHKHHGGGGFGGGSYARGPWRHTDQVGDSRPWSESHNTGGGRGGSRGRGRSGGGGGSRGGIHHHSARIIPDHKDFNQVIENGCGGKGSGNKQMGGRYDNNEVLVSSGTGGGRKGSKGNRQRYGGGRGRGRGPPQTFTPSSLHNSAQDWS
ncbi:hypothetical protein Pcinc_002247 [Petrolisthes cinctipes]|uniref:E3 ubiquitin-protein ligase RNF25 n=1 Tax=Petrolisthes cinctipes TaxID=88211 RepID=A0AAE1GIK8_PETCI|nr:hypothetical protein Pcinc_002247 [Petrolisthes cinctipes]